MLGDSPAMQALRERLARIAVREIKVLVTGESGTGKEVVARALHAQSRRALNAFEPVNCAGVPETLLESELFGYAKGSFTGAYHDQIGKMEAAHMGTVFLDEVGEMSLHMQATLLRFLETGEIQKVGVPGRGRTVDTRVIAATNRDLAAMIGERAFREDLYYRLNVVRIVVPPLRQRREDIPELLAHYLAHFSTLNESPVSRFHPEARRLLLAYDWPGNVRELENVIEGLTVLSASDEITVADLPDDIRRGQPGSPAATAAATPSLDALYRRMTVDKEPFWTVIYPLFMARDLTREEVRTLVRRGLVAAHGNYRLVVRTFGLDPGDYKRFMNFLRQHDLMIPFREYR